MRLHEANCLTPSGLLRTEMVPIFPLEFAHLDV
jgi:hypothetical protein